MSNTINNANEVQVFSNANFGQVRSMMIDGEPWFVGRDVAEILGYKELAKAVRDKVDDDDKGVSVLDTPGGKQEIKIINEAGLYSLILSSKLPTAKAFKRWVTSEVLPSIRKTGGYGNALPPITPELLYAWGDQIKQLKLENATLLLQNSEAEEANESIRFTPNKDGNYTVSSIAQVYGMTAQELNIILRDKGIQYKDPSNGKWRLCTQYLNKGYESIRAYYQHTDGTMSWTPKGLEFLKERMACWGYSYKQN